MIEHSETWYSKSWRPMAAYIYMIICLFDFAIMPLYGMYAHHISISELVILSLKYADPIAAYTILHSSSIWTPITLMYSGMFHAAMGAVLGVSAWTRGQEKIAKVSQEPTNINTQDTTVAPEDINAK